MKEQRLAINTWWISQEVMLPGERQFTIWSESNENLFFHYSHDAEHLRLLTSLGMFCTCESAD